MGELFVQRIYERDERRPGSRVLVDRLWPRGVRKESAHLDLWAKGAAPSHALRKWFGHDPERFSEFASRYVTELDQSEEAEALLAWCAERMGEGDVVLLYAAKDPDCNHALVLRDWLQQGIQNSSKKVL